MAFEYCEARAGEEMIVRWPGAPLDEVVTLDNDLWAPIDERALLCDYQFEMDMRVWDGNVYEREIPLDITFDEWLDREIKENRIRRV